jgi:hypothetical protein
LFHSEKIFRTTRELEYFFLSCKARIFFPEFNIRLYDKNSQSDYFFFLHQRKTVCYILKLTQYCRSNYHVFSTEEVTSELLNCLLKDVTGSLNTCCCVSVRVKSDCCLIPSYIMARTSYILLDDDNVHFVLINTISKIFIVLPK